MTRSGGDGSRWMRHVVQEQEAGRSVQEVLTGSMGVSRRMIQRLTRSRGITLNGRAPRLSGRVSTGDRLAIRTAADEEPNLVPVKMDLRVLYEDADVLVVDKPASLLVHPLNPSHTATLAHGVAHHFATAGVRARVRPLHRLDRDTSGLVVIARNAYAHQHLDRQLREGTLSREYLAFAEGTIVQESGSITAPIGVRAGSPHLRAVMPDGDPAVTRYRVIARADEMTMVEVQLETGRTHQIRVHLSHIGHPLLGDRQYGARPRPGLARQALHAHRVRFVQPVTELECSVEAPLPDDLAPLAERVHRSG